MVLPGGNSSCQCYRPGVCLISYASRNLMRGNFLRGVFLRGFARSDNQTFPLQRILRMNMPLVRTLQASGTARPLRVLRSRLTGARPMRHRSDRSRNSRRRRRTALRSNRVRRAAGEARPWSRLLLECWLRIFLLGIAERLSCDALVSFCCRGSKRGCRQCRAGADELPAGWRSIHLVRHCLSVRSGKTNGGGARRFLVDCRTAMR